MGGKKMIPRTVLICLAIALIGCGVIVQQKSGSGMFIDRELKIIDQHKALLVKSGRMAQGFGMAELVLGQYAWHGDGSGYFGAYSFYQPAFEQAKRGWFLAHGYVIEGNNELWVDDDNIKFDDTVKGRSVNLAMFWYENVKHKDARFQAKIIGLPPEKDCAHCLLLDKRAPHYAEQYQVQILPEDWVNMCSCINNFGPKFADGHPVVEP